VAIAELLAALDAQAEARAEQELAAARAEAARIAELAAAQLAAASAARVSDIESSVRRETEAQLSAERRRARTEVLRERHAMVERVLAAAAACFPSAIAARRVPLERHLAEALAHIDGAGARVRCRPELRPQVEPLAAARGLAVEDDPSAGWGIIAVDASGRIEVDNTLEARLGRMRAGLAVALARKVEEGAGDRLG
jgi:vacuolar-type H+-ATPase subunit E/Vma4